MSVTMTTGTSSPVDASMQSSSSRPPRSRSASPMAAATAPQASREVVVAVMDAARQTLVA